MTIKDKKIFINMFKILFRGIMAMRNWDTSILGDYKHFVDNDLQHWIKEK
jgi:hypothetical protein